MAKISAFAAIGNKKKIVEADTTVIPSNYYDDDFAIRNQSLATDPNIIWTVGSQHFNSDGTFIGDKTNLFSIINGDNFHSKVDYYLYNKGYFVNDEKLNAGYIPIDFKMVGSSRSFDYEVVQEPSIVIGNYTESIRQYDRFVYDIGTGYSLISNKWEMTEEDFLNKINSQNPSSWNKDYTSNNPNGNYSLLYTKCYDGKTGEPITLISMSQIMFSIEKLSISSPNQVYFLDPKDESNDLELINDSKYWIVNSSDVYILKGHDKFNNLPKPNWVLTTVTPNDYRDSYWRHYNTLGLMPACNVVQVQNGTRYSINALEVNFMDRVVIKNFITDITFKSLSNIDRNEIPWSKDFIASEDITKQSYVEQVNSRLASRFKNIFTNDVSMALQFGKTKPFFSGHFKDPSGKSSAYIYGNMKDRPYFGVDNNGKMVSFTKYEDYVKWVKTEFGYDVIKGTIGMYIRFDELTTEHEETLSLQGGNITTRFYYRDEYKSHLTINLACPKLSTPVLSSDILGVVKATWSPSLQSKVDEYRKVKINVTYDPDESPLFKKIPRTSEHYSVARSLSDDLLISDDVDKLLKIDNLTDDYFISSILKNDDVKLNDLNKSNQEAANVSIVNEIHKQIDLSSDIKDKDKYIAKQVINEEFTKNEITKKRLTREYVPINDQEYSAFKTIFFSNLLNESKTGLMGHNRILNANPSESPIYSKLTEIGLSDDIIKSYTENLKTEFDSLISGDSFQLIDSIDMMNEVNIINSMVSAQMSNLSNSIDDVAKAIENIKEMTDEGVKSVYDKISNIFSSTNQLIDNMTQSANQYREKLNSFGSDLEGSYDQLLLNRNVDNATKYTSNLVNALISDPYIALKQHNLYLKDRMNKVSLKSTFYNKVTDIMDFIPKVPSLVVDSLMSVGNLILTVTKAILTVATEAITIIDNIDKLFFISEQYLSKGIVDYSTIPTVFDDMFDKIDLDPIGYMGIQRKVKIVVDGANITQKKLILEILNDTKNNPIVVNNVSYKYNNYVYEHLFGDLSSGYYYPKSNISNYPILLPVSEDKIDILPDLTDFIPSYPQRGSLWKFFLEQVSTIGDQSLMSEIKELSPFIPLTPLGVTAYAGIVIGIAAAAGAAAALSAGLKGDWIGMMVGAGAALAAVGGANSMELYSITKRRHLMSEMKDVYTYLTNNSDKLSKLWKSKLIDKNFLLDNFIFISTTELRPLFMDASPFKKFYLLVKELLFLTANMTLMFGAAMMIGKLGQKIGMKIRSMKFRKALKLSNKREMELFKEQADKRKEDINKDKQNIINDASLTQQEKDDKIKQLDEDLSNIDDWLKGKAILNPTNKIGLNGILAANYSVGSVATSSSSSAVQSLSKVGALTATAIKPFTTAISKFNDLLSPDQKEANDSALQGSLDSVGSLVESTSSLMKILTRTDKNVDIIKKYT